MKLNNRLLSWAHYEYASTPLCFIKLGNEKNKLPNQIIVDLLYLFDMWYGNTEQETTKWALEYQLLARMLISDGALLVNPKYLVLDFENGARVPNELADILNRVSPMALNEYDKARALTQEEINQMYIEQADNGESDMKHRRVMITRCGYAVVPADSDAIALENAKKLGEESFDWEPVNSALIEETCEVIEACNEYGGI